MTPTAVVCVFCDSIQAISYGSCRNCGAQLTESLARANVAKSSEQPAACSAETPGQPASEALRALQYAQRKDHGFRRQLTMAALVLAVLTGVFWQRSQRVELAQANAIPDSVSGAQRALEAAQSIAPAFDSPLRQARFAQSLAAFDVLHGAPAK